MEHRSSTRDLHLPCSWQLFPDDPSSAEYFQCYFMLDINCINLIFLLFQKQFFDVVPISATGFLPPESNATTTPTTTTPGISSGAASTTSPLNTGDVGGGKSGQQVCTFTVSLISSTNCVKHAFWLALTCPLSLKWNLLVIGVCTKQSTVPLLVSDFPAVIKN